MENELRISPAVDIEPTSPDRTSLSLPLAFLLFLFLYFIFYYNYILGKWRRFYACSSLFPVSFDTHCAEVTISA